MVNGRLTYRKYEDENEKTITVPSIVAGKINVFGRCSLILSPEFFSPGLSPAMKDINLLFLL